MDSIARSPNGFLASLADDDFELIRPHLRVVNLLPELVLVEVDETLKRAYLPHSGVISLVVKLAKGERVQVAMVGRDSIFGAFSALGDPTALNSAVVLVPGIASTLDIERLRIAADQSATFRATLFRHGQAVYAQIQQTAGCNISHTVESRLGRCLLQTHDLSGSDKLVLTQESMAQITACPWWPIPCNRRISSTTAGDASRSPIRMACEKPPASATRSSRPSTTDCFAPVARREPVVAARG